MCNLYCKVFFSIYKFNLNISKKHLTNRIPYWYSGQVLELGIKGLGFDSPLGYFIWPHLKAEFFEHEFESHGAQKQYFGGISRGPFAGGDLLLYRLKE